MKFLQTLLVGALLLGLSSCDAWLDVNENPNQAAAVPSGLLFTFATVQIAAHRSLELGQPTLYHSQNWISNRILGNWITPEDGDMWTAGVNNVWLDNYVDAGKNLTIAMEQSAELERPNEIAQSMLLLAHVYMETTLIWERVPFSEANQPDEFPEPAFDDQQDILWGIVDMIDEAVGMIDLNDPLVIGTQDPIYGGDMDSWLRFGNSFKLKVLMLLRGGGENVDSQIQGLIDNPNLIRNASQNALVRFGGPSINTRSRMLHLYAANDWFWSSEPTVRIMNEAEDPRRPVYMQENNAGEYAAPQAGSTLGAGASRINLNTYMRDAMPDIWLTADEVLFLEAEFFARQNNLEQANQKYTEALTQAFAALPDNAGTAVSPSDISEFMAGRPHLADLGQADALTEILEQHFVAIFGRGIEAWTLTRRVGEAFFGLHLHPGYQLSNFITRWYYPTSEITTNVNTPTDPALSERMWFQSRSGELN